MACDKRQHNNDDDDDDNNNNNNNNNAYLTLGVHKFSTTLN
jgi:hypothetical protein